MDAGGDACCEKTLHNPSVENTQWPVGDLEPGQASEMAEKTVQPCL